MILICMYGFVLMFLARQEFQSEGSHLIKKLEDGKILLRGDSVFLQHFSLSVFGSIEAQLVHYRVS